MDWTWFYSLYSLAALFMILGLLWKIVIIPLFLVTFAFNETMRRFLMYIIVNIPGYFMASYAGVMGMYVNEWDRSWEILLTGGIFLFMYLAMGVSEAQKEADREMDYTNQDLINARMIGTYVVMLYYIAVIIWPEIGINETTTWVALKIDWIQNLPFVGWIVAIFAFLYVIYMVVVFAIMLLGIITIALSSISKIFIRS